MAQLGYVRGHNLVVESRYADGKPERLPALAAELAQLKVDVIVAAAYAAGAAKDATSTIPIVMANNGDPVRNGLVASLARPGGNVTGMSTLSLDLVGKQLQLLKEAIPRLTRVALLGNPSYGTAHATSVREAETAARALKLHLQIVEARTPTDLTAAVASAVKESADALVIPGDPMFFGQRTRIATLAKASRLAVIAAQSEYTEAGALLAYGTDHRESFRRAATFVDRILKGARPADLPIEQATKLELIVNSSTAKAIAVRIAPAVLSRADRIIE